MQQGLVRTRVEVISMDGKWIDNILRNGVPVTRPLYSLKFVTAGSRDEMNALPIPGFLCQVNQGTK